MLKQSLAAETEARQNAEWEVEAEQMEAADRQAVLEAQPQPAATAASIYGVGVGYLKLPKVT